jgi:8-oxo-dGTP pyrophosphatase MutT (NUDIX family)
MNEDFFHLGIKALIKNADGKILLLKVNTAKLKDFHGEPYWDIPGGRVQKGDSQVDTLKRELFEETGVSNIHNIKPIAMVLSKIRIPLKTGGDVGLILSIFSCNIDGHAKITISDENTEYKWSEPNEASKLLEFKYPEEFTALIK